jgi:hypothetical protein
VDAPEICRLWKWNWPGNVWRNFSMPKVKPILAATADSLAEALGLSATEAKEWQVQHVLLKRLKEIARQHKFTHAEIAKRSGTSRTRVTSILNDDLEHVSTDLLPHSVTA